MAKGIYTIVLLIVSNLFMTFAWYGHLQFQKIDWLKNTGLIGIVAISWGIALFEYAFQVPANRIGHIEHGGPFSMFELKTIQEAVSISVFVLVNIYVFKEGNLQWNHILGFALIVLAVFVIFKKW
ncbi:MAG: DMT family protein [Bacteroidota bacterium]